MIKFWQVVLIGFLTVSQLSATDLMDALAPDKDSRTSLKTAYKKCAHVKTHGMQGADCSKRELTELPRNLKSNIEILDATYNRLRRIDSVASYSKLKYLYLGDNFIVYLEPGTVDQLDHLEALDLSANAMQDLPAYVFQISTLRRLYITNNTFRRDFLSDVELPIKAPLEVIDLSYSQLPKMPYLGVMPDLYVLNISGNPISNITVDHLSPLCRLKVLNITDIPPNKIGVCECFKLQKYLVEQRVEVYPEVRAICDYNFEAALECGSRLNDTDLTLHYECMGKIRIREKRKQARTTWTAVFIGISSFLIIFIAILYILHVKNVRNMELEEMRRRKNNANHTLIKNKT